MSISPLAAKPSADLQPRTGLSAEARKAVAAVLTEALGDIYVLMVKTQAYHWNVTGPLFFSLHKMTEEQYEDLFEAVDDLAERLRALGRRAPFTFAAMAEAAAVGEHTGDTTAATMIDTLARDHETVAQAFRTVVERAESVGDSVTADMATERIEAHEQAIWMLRALLDD